MVAPLDDTNKQSSQSIFLNDCSSQNISETLKREKELALAAKIKADAEALALENERKEKERAIQEELQKLRDAKTELEKKKTELEGRIKSLDTQLSESKQQVKKVEGERNALMPLGERNNLDPSWHGKSVSLLNIASKTAIDGGADGGTRAHGWKYHPENAHQWFTLEKVNPSDRNSSWTIRSDDWRFMTFLNDGNDAMLSMQKSRPSSHEGCQRQEWFIGCDETGQYYFRNLWTKKYIHLYSTKPEECGPHLIAKDKISPGNGYNGRTEASRQWFGIIRKF